MGVAPAYIHVGVTNTMVNKFLSIPEVEVGNHPNHFSTLLIEAKSHSPSILEIPIIATITCSGDLSLLSGVGITSVPQYSLSILIVYGDLNTGPFATVARNHCVKL